MPGGIASFHPEKEGMKTTNRTLALVHDSSEAPLAPLSVMIIDDQSTGRIVLSEIVRGLDTSLEVVTFADPMEAIEYARKHPALADQ